MMIREIAPAVPARNLRRAVVNPAVEVERQPRPVLICGLESELPGHPAVGSKAREILGERREKIEKSARNIYVRIETCFLL